MSLPLGAIQNIRFLILPGNLFKQAPSSRGGGEAGEGPHKRESCCAFTRCARLALGEKFLPSAMPRLTAPVFQCHTCACQYSRFHMLSVPSQNRGTQRYLPGSPRLQQGLVSGLGRSKQ